MPKLDAAAAKRTKTAEKSAGWDMEPGPYVVELVKVHDKDKTGKTLVGKESGVPFWEWEVIFPDDANEGQYKRRRLRFITSTGESSDGMRHAAFHAFGGDPEQDTDELTGRRAIAVVKNETYNGTKSAKVAYFLPIDDDDESAGGKAAAEDDEANY